MVEVSLAVRWGEVIEDGPEVSPRAANRALVSFSEQGLELGKDNLGRVQIPALGRQEQQVGSGVSDQLPWQQTFVAAEVVGDLAGSLPATRALPFADPRHRGHRNT